MPRPDDTPDRNPDRDAGIIRHAEPVREFELSTGDPVLMEAVEEHLSKFVGEAGSVFHELVSDLVHVDVHMIPPSEERPWHTLMTSGMAERPMTLPPGAAEGGCPRYAEVMLCLPADWPLDQASMDVPNRYWPIGLLKYLARFPHQYKTFLAEGHTIPNGDPPEPFAPNTSFCGALIATPVMFDDGFETFRAGDREVAVLSVIPLWGREMDFKLRRGAGALLEKLDEDEVGELLEPDRPSVV